MDQPAFLKYDQQVLILHNICFSHDICRSDGVGTVTQEEKEKFTEIKERLRVQLEYQLTNFRFCFPFGRPEGALKSTLSLLERVRQQSVKLVLLHLSRC